MNGCTAIFVFCKTCQIGFVHVGVVWAARVALRELSQQSNNRCVRTALCTMTKLVWRQFWHALQPSLTQYERSMYHMKEKLICYHPLITILWFVILILGDLALNLGFLFLNSHCTKHFTVHLLQFKKFIVHYKTEILLYSVKKEIFCQHYHTIKMVTDGYLSGQKYIFED